MMGVPTVEHPPGIKEPWHGMWRYALIELKASGLWRPVLRPLLDEYITCYRLAAEQRAIAESSVQVIHHRGTADTDAWDETLPAGIQRNKESGMDHPHPSFSLSLKYLAEARNLADLLGLSPKASKVLAKAAEESIEEPDAFAIADELAQRRRPAVA